MVKPETYNAYVMGSVSRSKKIQSLIFSILAAVAILGIWSSRALAAPNWTKPYFYVDGASVFTGGWFNTTTSCSTTDPRYQAYDGTPNSAYEGGIMSYAALPSSDHTQNSYTSMGAFALGNIEADATQQYGFFSGIQTATDPPNHLSFADTSNLSLSYGGYFAGTGAVQAHCIPDYFDSKLSQIDTYPWDATTRLNNAFPVGYYVDSYDPSTCPGAGDCVGGIFKIMNAGSEGVIQDGARFTVFVKGNVYIDHDIITSSYHYTGDQAVQKFALVVKGNIFIDPTVNRLDGLYIAQPDMSDSDPLHDDTGNIWTCHYDTLDAPTKDAASLSAIANQCHGNKLDVYGAFIAKNVYLMRTFGKITTDNYAERFHWPSFMVVGGPFFNQDDASSVKVDSIISLPPAY